MLRLRLRQRDHVVGDRLRLICPVCRAQHQLHLSDLQGSSEFRRIIGRERDRRDSQRATAPLKPAEDARLLDTSCMGIEEVVKKVLEWWDETKKLS